MDVFYAIQLPDYSTVERLITSHAVTCPADRCVRFRYATRRTESSWGRTKVRLEPSFRSGLTGCRSSRRQPGVWWPHDVHRKYICSCSNWSMLSWPCRPQNIWRTRSITRPLNPSISVVFACLTLVRVASGDRTERLLLPIFRLLLPPSTGSSSKRTPPAYRTVQLFQETCRSEPYLPAPSRYKTCRPCNPESLTGRFRWVWAPLARWRSAQGHRLWAFSAASQGRRVGSLAGC